MKRPTYLVTLQQEGKSDWGAWVPDLPGCVAVAKSVDGALRRITIAIEMHIQGMREDGQRPPRPKRRSVRPRSSNSGCEFFATV